MGLADYAKGTDKNSGGLAAYAAGADRSGSGGSVSPGLRDLRFDSAAPQPSTLASRQTDQPRLMAGPTLQQGPPNTPDINQMPQIGSRVNTFLGVPISRDNPDYIPLSEGGSIFEDPEDPYGPVHSAAQQFGAGLTGGDVENPVRGGNAIVDMLARMAGETEKYGVLVGALRGTGIPAAPSEFLASQVAANMRELQKDDPYGGKGDDYLLESVGGMAGAAFPLKGKTSPSKLAQQFRQTAPAKPGLFPRVSGDLPDELAQPYLRPTETPMRDLPQTAPINRGRVAPGERLAQEQLRRQSSALVNEQSAPINRGAQQVDVPAAESREAIPDPSGVVNRGAGRRPRSDESIITDPVEAGQRDWANGALAIDGDGNFRLRSTRKIAPYNKELKRHYNITKGDASDGVSALHRDAQQYKAPKEKFSFARDPKSIKTVYNPPRPAQADVPRAVDAKKPTGYDAVKQQISDDLGTKKVTDAQLMQYAKRKQLPLGQVQRAYDEVRPLRSVQQIDKDIERVQEQMYKRSKTGRAQGGSAGAYNRDIQNLQKKLDNLRVERERSIADMDPRAVPNKGTTVPKKGTTVPKGGGENLASVAGAAYGFEQNEDGSVTFNPTKAAIGVAASFAAIGLMKGKGKPKAKADAAKAYDDLMGAAMKDMKPPQQDKVMRHEADVSKQRRIGERTGGEYKPKERGEPIMSPNEAKASVAKFDQDAIKRRLREIEKADKSFKTEAGNHAYEAIAYNTDDFLDAANDVKDIGSPSISFGDFTRNNERVWGKKLGDKLTEQLDGGKKRWTDMVRNKLDWLQNEIVKKHGIRKGTKMSAAVQKYGEQSAIPDMLDEIRIIEDQLDRGVVAPSEIGEAKKYVKKLRQVVDDMKGHDEAGLVKRYGREKADRIIAADKEFRKQYDAIIDEVNEVRRVTYGAAPDEYRVITKTKSGKEVVRKVETSKEAAQAYIKNNKIEGATIRRDKAVSKEIPKRKDYYRHFQSLNEGTWMDFYDVVKQDVRIDPKLVGVSEFTQPKQTWKSYQQKRSGPLTKYDAVGGFLNYVPQAAHNIHIDPQAAMLRRFKEELINATVESKNLNKYIKYLDRFADDLQGKTNFIDRPFEDVIGRRGIAAVSFLNNRVARNTIGLNLSTAVVQPVNLVQGVADAGTKHSIVGAADALRSLMQKNPNMARSPFMRERYLSLQFEKFDTRWLRPGTSTRRLANWILNAADGIGTSIIWNSQYRKALASGAKNPIRVADVATRKLVAGRGIGEVPVAFKSRMGKLALNFQYEVGNVWWVMRDFTTQKQFDKLAKFFLGAFIANEFVFEPVIGRRVMIDPIDAGRDMYAIANSDDDDKVLGVLGRAAGEVMSELPAGQFAASFLGDRHTREKFFGDADPARFGSPIAATRPFQELLKGDVLDATLLLAPPVGGNQLRKTIGGAKALGEGEVTKSDGDKMFGVDTNNPVDVIKTLVMGPYATDEAREYFSGKKKRKTTSRTSGRGGSRGSGR